MCGILGGINLAEKSLLLGLKSMIHRGPDSTGTFITEFDSGNVALGMNRLAITGISTGAQPLYSLCEKVVLTFNGEIYNYKELWSNLGLDRTPRSDGDVIIELYLKYGVDGLKELRGMFAIALYDKRNKKILLLRDWFGEKPLYIFKGESSLIWSSNINGILANINKGIDYEYDVIVNYFRFTYTPTEKTVYEGVTSLEPGVCLEFDHNMNLITTYRLKKQLLSNNFSYSSDLFKLLFKKVEGGLIGETEIGVLLSGGIDSGIVASISSKLLKRTELHAFTIASNDEQYNEAIRARNMASFLEMKHDVINFHQEFDADEFYNIITRLEQPYADSSFVVSWTAFRYIKRKYPKIKVVLTGDGGDEIWGGYNKHKILRFPKLLRKFLQLTAPFLIRKNLINRLMLKGLRLKTFRLLKSYTWKSTYMGILSLGFDRVRLSRLFDNYEDDFTIEPDNLQEAIELDHRYSLCHDLNVKTDQASMYNSIEARSPLLDIDMYMLNRNEFISKQKISKELEYLFPKNYINQKKKGFAFNIAEFIFKDFEKYSSIYLKYDKIDNIPFINTESAAKIIRDFYNGNILLAYEIYTVLIASIWFNSKNREYSA